jgi:acetylornithine deacetylase
MSTYSSPILADQALYPFTTVKIGPCDSARSHTTDEYIRLVEVKKGVYQFAKGIFNANLI